jgi:hypothetical protein
MLVVATASRHAWCTGSMSSEGYSLSYPGHEAGRLQRLAGTPAVALRGEQVAVCMLNRPWASLVVRATFNNPCTYRMHTRATIGKTLHDAAMGGPRGNTTRNTARTSWCCCCSPAGHVAPGEELVGPLRSTQPHCSLHSSNSSSSSRMQQETRTLKTQQHVKCSRVHISNPTHIK